jgi:hypothetical protein
MNLISAPLGSLSNYALDWLFPLSTIIAIREPYVKHGLNGYMTVRVEVPRDIVVPHPGNLILMGSSGLICPS